MGPYYGPLPPLKDSDVWALTLYRVCKGYRGSRHHVTTFRRA